MNRVPQHAENDRVEVTLDDGAVIDADLGPCGDVGIALSGLSDARARNEFVVFSEGDRRVAVRAADVARVEWAAKPEVAE